MQMVPNESAISSLELSPPGLAPLNAVSRICPNSGELRNDAQAESLRPFLGWSWLGLGMFKRPCDHVLSAT
jgi:hypothetical protein